MKANIKKLLRLVLDQIGYGTDNFQEKSKEIFNLVKEHGELSFTLGREYSLILSFEDEKDEDKTLHLTLVGFISGQPKELLSNFQFGFRQETAKFCFLSLIGACQRKLREMED